MGNWLMTINLLQQNVFEQLGHVMAAYGTNELVVKIC